MREGRATEPPDLIEEHYTAQDIRDIRTFLEAHGTFRFPSLKNGLYPAVISRVADATASGYHYVWVRDNVFIAYAHYLNGKVGEAAATAKTLATYFKKHVKRFDDVIQGRVDSGDPMQRPHVRFEGGKLEEVDQKWPHAQNDALGYFLWFYATLACEKHVEPTQEDMACLATVAQYLRTIRFWEDQDSGHWEEVRKIEASSIGIVVGGLRTVKRLYELRGIDVSLIDELLLPGQEALHRILPNECVQEDPQKRRAYDAALLFLIYPTHVVDDSMADQILHNVVTHLQGSYGIRRYLNDSYWCANYKNFFKPEERAVDFSDNITSRDALLRQGEEAQWCIFDPIISAIYGDRFQRSRSVDDLKKQVTYLNRSLRQLTGSNSEFGGFKCPEAYYIENGHYVPNDHTPLLWAQANLWIALKEMEASLSES